MASFPICIALRATVKVLLLLAGLTVLFLSYYKSVLPLKCHPPPARGVWLAKQANLHNMSVPGEQAQSHTMIEQRNKPVMLLWFWPENKRFDLHDCKALFNIDSCQITDNRSLYSRAEGVLVFHRAICDDLSNLPTSRTRFQRWIWFNMDSPTDTRRIAGIDGLFNLTLSYRRDSDISVHWKLTFKMNTDGDFVLPKKERLLCWIVDSNELHTNSGERNTYYRELAKHVKVDIFHSSSDALKGENYFLTISSCKFYLSFENSVHRDYITETFNGPLAAGTVPIVLGPPRRNYENFAPGTSFIHVNDFPDAATLADFLLSLERDNKAYMKFFEWQKFYTARRHPTEEKHKFANAICQACHYVAMNKEHRVIPDLGKWFFE